MKKNTWSRNELIVAFNLYCKTPFSKIGLSNKGIQELSGIINRSVSAVALKLANFARLDPTIQNRGLSGMRNGSKAEIDIWNEFNENWEELAYESERILSEYKGISLEKESDINDVIITEGKERIAAIKLRVNQNFFRKTVLASYNNKCCITGLNMPELLVAGHIIPWAADAKNRMNPSNGLCLNALHDRAFDKGLITVTPDYEIKVSDKILKNLKKVESESFFLPYQGKKVTMPQKFLPEREFLEYHNTEVFQK